ncbi:hypothetical protein QAD02_019199 [Eretmocerus hayati]|uniref:Uncharacterized protein n=1 Tax=Eretmocerus hayati TaxID=131215 RepID=A0ACC2PJ74_9HYME|nr:hypothetical protein QAD02_019199 [Eretmocerus hayati]
MSSPIAGTSTGLGGTKSDLAFSSSSPTIACRNISKGNKKNCSLPKLSPIPGPSTNSEARGYLNLSPRRVAFLRKTSRSTAHNFVDNIEENDDEKERSARRNLDQNNNSSLNISLHSGQGSASILDLSLSSDEVSNHISECLKLKAENKINQKNAFQLKMIDFLVSVLRKQNPSIDLSHGSAYLDVSSSIYGFRVDGLHSTVYKVLGASNSRKRKSDDNSHDREVNDDFDGDDRVSKNKRIRTKPLHILTNSEDLRTNVETYDPRSLVQHKRDAISSEMLLQLDQVAAVTSCKDLPVIDRIPCKQQGELLQKYKVITVENNAKIDISPFARFSFLSNSSFNIGSRLNNNFHSEDRSDHKNGADLRELNDNQFESSDALDDSNQPQPLPEVPSQLIHRMSEIHDFVDEISNISDPNTTYEYSYLRKKYIQWSGPAHWKFIFKNHALDNQREVCHLAKRRKKEVELTFTREELKHDIAQRFIRSKCSNRLCDETVVRNWSDNQNGDPSRFYSPHGDDLRRYFNDKPLEENFYQERFEEHSHNFDLNEFIDRSTEDSHHFGDLSALDENDNHLNMSAVGNLKPFVGDNLVEMPKQVHVAPFLYPYRAKKVDMHELKNAIRKSLKFSQDDQYNNSKLLSDIYKEMPTHLSRANVVSLSPALAYVSLMHVVSESNIEVNDIEELSDIIVNLPNERV